MGSKIGTKCPIPYAKEGQVHPSGFGDEGRAQVDAASPQSAQVK
jgi:hypothetical protein